VPDARYTATAIKAKAHELGFLACGVARAGFLDEEAPRLEQWLRQGRHGEMGYMANHFDLRLDPRKLVPGAKSVISLAYNYFTPLKQEDPEAPKLSTYAYGRDYHKVVKKRLKPLMDFIVQEYGEVAMRAFVDSAPVLEKAWAQRAGIGWVGKHTNIIIKPTSNPPPHIFTRERFQGEAASGELASGESIPQPSNFFTSEGFEGEAASGELASGESTPQPHLFTRERYHGEAASGELASGESTPPPPTGGSYFFLCEIILDLELEPDAPATDHCGTCRRCIDACPTEAITPYGVDGSRCISYLTIELKDAIPQEFAGRMEGWAFGCDICQQVCPWNRFSTPHQEPAFEPKPELMHLTAHEWKGMTEVLFERVFEGSAVKRTKYAGLMRNVKFLDASGD
jgi:epoxyqueuosine reductase QueG